jgi:hypothetical protein
MTQDDILYALACYQGEDPNWKEAYKEAYKTCMAQQQKLDAERVPLEQRILDIIAAAAKDGIGRIQIQFSGDEYRDERVEVWVPQLGHYYRANTIADALAKAAQAVREAKALETAAIEKVKAEAAELAESEESETSQELTAGTPA